VTPPRPSDGNVAIRLTVLWNGHREQSRSRLRQTTLLEVPVELSTIRNQAHDGNLRAPHAVAAQLTQCGLSLSGLWPKAEPAPVDGLVCILSLSPEWNADKTRVDKVLYWTAVARLFCRIDLCSVGVYGVDLVMRIPPQHTNVGCLACFV
jgi:hypothetical protein